MYKLGVHHLVWHADVGKTTCRFLPTIREAGYDGIEIPIFSPESLDTDELSKYIGSAGLLCTTSTALPVGLSLIDEPVIEETILWIRAVIKATSELGSFILCGPLILPVGELRGRGFTEKEFVQAVKSLKILGDIAADNRVTLALEPLNRFETFFLNTTADGVRLMDAVDNEYVGLLLDTFHMNIEEKSVSEAIFQGARHLKHFHCSENDRGIVGSGQVPWNEVFESLRGVGYEGWLVVESFGSALPELAAATCMWRLPAPSPEVLAQESIDFIRQQTAIND